MNSYESTDNLWREEYFTLQKIKVPEFFNIKFSFNMSFFVMIIFLIHFILIWLLSLLLKYKTLINVKYDEKELIKGMKN